ncbi:MAG: hypothetical protein JNK65_03670 [Deltaproteobacteria bacterium]|nr:hypothetical protein [Deltaproteobacteria bacterium]
MKKIFTPFKKTFFLFSLLMTVVACNEMPIYHDLTESDANEILVALHDRGIEASKIKEEKSQQVSWSIVVSQKDSTLAQKVLIENKLPKQKQLGFSGICKEKGLIPTPEEEKCRKILALKGEIINSLEKIPGVIDADVVLNIPEISEFATESQPTKKPTASAVIRLRKSALESSDLNEAKLQRFISNTVENLDPRDVSVVITIVQPPEDTRTKEQPTVSSAVPANLVSVAGLKMDPPSQKKFKIMAIAVLGVLLLESLAVIMILFKMLKLRKQTAAATGAMDFNPNPAMLQAPEADPNQISSTGAPK